MLKEISIYQLLKFDVKYILCEFVHFVEPFFFLAILMTIIVKTRTIPTKMNLLKIVLAILMTISKLQTRSNLSKIVLFSNSDDDRKTNYKLNLIKLQIDS